MDVRREPLGLALVRYVAVARSSAIRRITPSERAREAKVRGGTAALRAMEGHLAERRFLVGERYTIADIGLYAYTHVAPEGGFALSPTPLSGHGRAGRRSAGAHAITD